jgi:hypothetical protein
VTRRLITVTALSAMSLTGWALEVPSAAAEISAPGTPLVLPDPPRAANQLTAGPGAVPAPQPAIHTVGDAIQVIGQAKDPSDAMAAFSRGMALDRNDLKLHEAYLKSMTAFDLPDAAAYSAQVLLTQQPDNGLAWAVTAVAAAKRGDLPTAATDMVMASTRLPDDAFVQRTAGQILAWYDTAPDRAGVAASIVSNIETLRPRLQKQQAFSEAYLQATKAYQDMAAAAKAAGQAQPGPAANATASVAPSAPAPASATPAPVPPTPTAEAPVPAASNTQAAVQYGPPPVANGYYAVPQPVNPGATYVSTTPVVYPSGTVVYAPAPPVPVIYQPAPVVYQYASWHSHPFLSLSVGFRGSHFAGGIRISDGWVYQPTDVFAPGYPGYVYPGYPYPVVGPVIYPGYTWRPGFPGPDRRDHDEPRHRR